MRAAFSIYEHPQLTRSDVWPKSESTSTDGAYLYPAIGMVSIAASSLAAAAYYYALSPVKFPVIQGPIMIIAVG
jgi:hypothetical protein